MKKINIKNNKEINTRYNSSAIGIDEPSGITLIALVITIILMIILASIGSYYGAEIIKNAKMENIRTNMLLINAKAKEYCEEANFKLGTGSVPTDDTQLQTYLQSGIEYLENQNEEEGKPALPNNVSLSDYSFLNGKSYQFISKLTKEQNQECLNAMGLSSIDNPEKYLIAFDIIQNKVEIFYIDGLEGEIDGNKGTFYSLADIKKI